LPFEPAPTLKSNPPYPGPILLDPRIADARDAFQRSSCGHLSLHHLRQLFVREDGVNRDRFRLRYFFPQFAQPGEDRELVDAEDFPVVHFLAFLLVAGARPAAAAPVQVIDAERPERIRPLVHPPPVHGQNLVAAQERVQFFLSLFATLNRNIEEFKSHNVVF